MLREVGDEDAEEDEEGEGEVYEGGGGEVGANIIMNWLHYTCGGSVVLCYCFMVGGCFFELSRQMEGLDALKSRASRRTSFLVQTEQMWTRRR